MLIKQKKEFKNMRHKTNQKFLRTPQETKNKSLRFINLLFRNAKASLGFDSITSVQRKKM